MKCGRRGGWWGSDRRKGTGNVGGRGGLDGGIKGGRVILKATREASCTGESFGSKNASHPHTSPPSTVTHPCLAVSKSRLASNMAFILSDSHCLDLCVMTSLSSQVERECVLDRGTKK